MVCSCGPREKAAISCCGVVTTIDEGALSGDGAGSRLSEPDTGVISKKAVQDTNTSQAATRRRDIYVSYSGPTTGPYPSERKTPSQTATESYRPAVKNCAPG